MSEAFGTNLPLWDQYLHFWDGLVHGDLGVSIYDFPARVTTLIFSAIPYTLALLVPAIVLSYLLGNRLGALGGAAQVARQHACCPVGYIFQAIPYPWLALAAAVPARRGLARVPDLRGVRRDPAARVLLDLHVEPALPLVPAVPHGVPREPRRLGHRDAQPGDLRAGERQLPVPAGARRERARGPPVRLPQRLAAAAVRPRPGPRGRDRRQHRHRDRLPLSRASGC